MEFKEYKSYKDFIDNYHIYFSYKEAKKKGFEVHHIVPKSLGGKDSDGLLRLTTFEHIYAHYLHAKDNPKYSWIFFNMICFNGSNISTI